MTVTNEERCIKILNEICKEHFDQDEYSLRGPKESAVCLEKTSSGWNVYENERNSHNDSFLFDNVIEAGLDLLKRLSDTVDYNVLKNQFFDAILSQRIAQSQDFINEASDQKVRGFLIEYVKKEATHGFLFQFQCFYFFISFTPSMCTVVPPFEEQ